MDRWFFDFLTRSLSIIPAIISGIIAVLLSSALFYLKKETKVRSANIILASVLMVLLLSSLLVGFFIKVKNSPIPHVTVQITSPAEGTNVQARAVVRGIVDDNDVEIFVLVRPLTTNDWYVQPSPSIVSKQGENYIWESVAYFGGKDFGLGERFVIVALATKEDDLRLEFRGMDLKVGEIARKLPNYPNISNLVTVKRF